MFCILLRCYISRSILVSTPISLPIEVYLEIPIPINVPLCPIILAPISLPIEIYLVIPMPINAPLTYISIYQSTSIPTWISTSIPLSQHLSGVAPQVRRMPVVRLPCNFSAHGVGARLGLPAIFTFINARRAKAHQQDDPLQGVSEASARGRLAAGRRLAGGRRRQLAGGWPAAARCRPAGGRPPASCLQPAASRRPAAGKPPAGRQLAAASHRPAAARCLGLDFCGLNQ